MESWIHTRRSNSTAYEINQTASDVVLQSVQKLSPTDLGAARPANKPPMQKCRGARIRFQAELATESADGAGFWLMANHDKWHLTDAMWDSLITGTTDYKLFQFVIDVPIETAYVSYGVYLRGNGKCLVRNPVFDLVDSSIPVTQDKFWDRVAKDRWEERLISSV